MKLRVDFKIIELSPAERALVAGDLEECEDFDAPVAESMLALLEDYWLDYPVQADSAIVAF